MMPHQFWKDALLLSTHLVVTLLLFVLVLTVIVFALRAPARKYKPFDLAVFTWLEPITSHVMTRFMLIITFFGKHQFLVPANLLLLFYFLLVSRHNWLSISVAAISLSSLFLMILLKQLFRRKRPLSPLLNAVRGLSFPSGHAIMAVTFFGLIIYILNQTLANRSLFIILTFCLTVFILLIGFSRIYLRVHYASDVVAGFLIGFLWLVISLYTVRQVESLISIKNSDMTYMDSPVFLSACMINYT